MFFFFKRYPLRLCPRRPSPSPCAHCGSSTVALHAWLAGKPLSSLFLKQTKSQFCCKRLLLDSEGEKGVGLRSWSGWPPTPASQACHRAEAKRCRHAEPPAPTAPVSTVLWALPPPQQQWLLPPVLLDLLYKPVLCCRRPGPGNEIQPNPSLPTLCPLPFCI